VEKEQLPPIHVVTEANQLPVDFLRPSPQAILIVGLDSEILSDRTLCLLKVSFIIFFFFWTLVMMLMCFIRYRHRHTELNNVLDALVYSTV
jgi:hypothetical protein